MRTPLLLVAPSSLSIGAAVAQQLTASLRGIVLDVDGKPVSNAIVYALPELNTKRQIKTIADAQGRFVFKALPPGFVYVDAFKASDGFPCNYFAFFGDAGHTASRIEVKAEGPPSDIAINVGQKAAHLTVNLTDTNGTPMKNTMRLTFNRDDMPGHYQTGGAAPPYSMLVPCVPFSFSVEVQGYDVWRSELIALKPGDALDIAAKLQTKSS